MKVRTLVEITVQDGNVVLRTLPVGTVGEFVRVVRDDVYGDDLVVIMPDGFGEMRIPAEDLEPVR